MNNLIVTNPYNGEELHSFEMMDEAGVENALQRASTIVKSKPLSKVERVQILQRALEILKPKRMQLASDAAAEGGKPMLDSLVEVDRGFQGIEVAISTLANMGGSEVPMGHTASSQNKVAFTIREPVGPVLAVSAFNHPFNLIIHQVIPAIATDCPVIVKPATVTPKSCFNVVEALYEAGLPPEWCQVVLCTNELTEKMVKDERIQFLTFIGSGRVGWYLRSVLAPGSHCALEHGGVAPVIVLDDANLDDMIPRLTKGGFYHAGQVCVSVQRVFTPNNLVDEVSQRIADLVGTWKLGNQMDDDTQIGPLIRNSEVDRVEQWVNQARDAGAQVLCGGSRQGDSCYQATVLKNPPVSANVTTQEIFGPVLNVYGYDNLDQAIAAANSLPFSFQSSVFGQNMDQLLRCAKELNAVAVMLNDHTAFRVDWMPFGGRMQSGLGMGGIPYTMSDMTAEKMVVMHSPEL